MGWIANVFQMFNRRRLRKLPGPVLLVECHDRSAKRRGVSRAERATEEVCYVQDRLAKSAANFRRDQLNASKVGVKSYIWRSSRDGDVCEDCLKLDGKKVAWDTAPVCGHPGTFICANGSPCRCYAESVIPA